MSNMHSFLLSSLLLAASLSVNGEEELNAPISDFKKAEIESPFIHTAQNFTPFTGAIIGTKVRMRIHPSLEGHVVRETTQGELFVVVDELNDYYAIIPPSETKGFVFRTFILDGAVEGERVNVRLFPDMDAPVVGQLNTGDKVHAYVSESNNKWLEIDLPENSRFYIAKEYIEQKGPPELLGIIEKKRSEAVHLLSAAAFFAQAEIQKPFEQIDLDCINEKFDQINSAYCDLPFVNEQVKEATTLLQDLYVQKKIAFLEGKAISKFTTSETQMEQLEKLARLCKGMNHSETEDMGEIISAASQTIGLFSMISTKEVTDKMLLWQPLEEAQFHLWAAVNAGKTIDEFYLEEEQSAKLLTGIVEAYNRHVKNKPGDYLLRDEGIPTAFLYSTRVNLEKLIGHKVTVLAVPRPNNNFAFDAFYVISIE